MALVPLILVCLAVIILAAPGWPSPQSLAAFVLALIALLWQIAPAVFK